MSKLWMAGRYAEYLLKARNRHGIHSPFVYKLLDEVVYDSRPYPEYAMADAVRKQLLSRTESIAITDLGAGSSINDSKQRKIADIARNSAKTGKWGKLLFRLARHFAPETMVELGTSLGMSALYQCLGSPSGRMITLEGCTNTAAVARSQLSASNIHNINIVEGDFENTLPKTLDALEKLDWAFVDGNHQQKPTVRYFEQCMEKCHAGSVLLFDDIYWSRGMAAAWEQIKQHPRVTVSLDLFQLGIVFLRDEQAKQDFIIRY